MTLSANETNTNPTSLSSSPALSSTAPRPSTVHSDQEKEKMTATRSSPFQVAKSAQDKVGFDSAKLKAIPKREPVDDEADPDSSTSLQKRKRTRPVSACEACRAHKVKCILKSDQPVCERCAASGKECLFRIDDLRPDFRAERFAHLGPPGKDARFIKSKPKDRDRTAGTFTTPATGVKASNGKAGAGRRRSSTASGAEASPTHDVGYGKPPKRSKGAFKSSTSAEEQEPKAPSLSERPASHNISHVSHAVLASVGRPSQLITDISPPSYISKAPGDSSFAPMPYSAHPRPQGSSVYATQNYGSYPRPPIRPTRPGPADHVYPHHTLSHLTSMSRGQKSGGGKPFFPQQQHYPQAGFASLSPAQSSQHGGHPHHHQHSNAHTISSGALSYHSPTSLSSISSARTPHTPDARTPADVGDGSAVACPPSNNESHRRTSSSSSGPGGGPHPPRSDSNDLALPSIRTIVPSLRHEEDSATSPSLYGGRRSGSTTGQSSASLFQRDSESRRLVDPLGRPPAVAVGSPSSQTSASRKQVMIPFFRWFGSTANTPGYRRIKVAVNPDLPIEEDDDALPDAEEENVKVTTERRELKGGSPSIPPANARPQPMPPGGGSSPVAAPSSSRLSKRNSMTSYAAPEDGNSPKSHRHSISGVQISLSAWDTESTSSASRDLFDRSRPRYPRPDILLHLSELFVQLFRTDLCPWVESESLLDGARNATLPSILANSICAMTARFSDWAELRRKSARNAGDPFSEMAKTLIVPMLSWPSVDVVEALILLSYAEFGAGSDSGLWMYSGMAMRMATDLGLQHESTIRNLPKASQEKARWLFWSGCYAIDRITCFGTGRPVTLLQHTIDCLPPQVEPGTPRFYASQIIQLLQRRGRMGEVLNGRGDTDNLHEKKAKLMDMWHECAVYFQSLPSSCAFSVQSFKRAASNGEGPAFLFLHILFQSTISLLERPGIMRGRNWADVHSITPPSLNTSEPSVAQISVAASRSIADMIVLAVKVDPKSIMTSPYLDQLILPTGRAFNAELKGIKAALEEHGYPTAEHSRSGSPVRTNAGPEERLTLLLSMRKAVSDNLQNCIDWLGTLAHYWGGASWPARALEQEAAGMADVMPDDRDDDAMQAPLRDMELLSAWARDKVKQAKSKSKMASRRGSADHTRGNSSGSASGIPAITAATEAETRAAKTETGGLTGLGSPGAATNIENLLAAANASREADDDDGDRALGHALSGRWAASAEINISALLDFWAEEQQNASFLPTGDTGAYDDANARRVRQDNWADNTALTNPATPSRYLDHSQTRTGPAPLRRIGGSDAAGLSTGSTLQGQTPRHAQLTDSTQQQQNSLTSWMTMSPPPHSSTPHQHHQQVQHHLSPPNLSGAGAGVPIYASGVGKGAGTHLLSGPGGGGSAAGSGNPSAATTNTTVAPNSTSFPLKGFSALQLEEFLSADLINGSGTDGVFPLELPDEPLFPFGELQYAKEPSSDNRHDAPPGGVRAGDAGEIPGGLMASGNGLGGGAAGPGVDAGSGSMSGGWGGLSQQHLSSALFGFR